MDPVGHPPLPPPAGGPDSSGSGPHSGSQGEELPAMPSDVTSESDSDVAVSRVDDDSSDESATKALDVAVTAAVASTQPTPGDDSNPVTPKGTLASPPVAAAVQCHPPGDSDTDVADSAAEPTSDVNPMTPSPKKESLLITKQDIIEILKIPDGGAPANKEDSVTLDNLHTWLNDTVPTRFKDLLCKFVSTNKSRPFGKCDSNQLMAALNELLPEGPKIDQVYSKFWTSFGNTAILRGTKMNKTAVQMLFQVIVPKWNEKNMTPQQRKMEPSLGPRSARSKSKKTPRHARPTWTERAEDTDIIKNNQGQDLVLRRVFTTLEATEEIHGFVQQSLVHYSRPYARGGKLSPEEWDEGVQQLGTFLVGVSRKCYAAKDLSEFCRYSFSELSSIQKDELEDIAKKLWRPLKYIELKKDGKPVTFLQGVIEVGVKGDNGFRVPICTLPIRLVGPGGYLYIIGMNCRVSVEGIDGDDGEEKESSPWNIMKVGKTDVFHTNKIPRLFSHQPEESIDPITGRPIAHSDTGGDADGGGWSGGDGSGSGPESKSDSEPDLDCLKSLEENELYVRARTPMERFTDESYKNEWKWCNLSRIQGGMGKAEHICSCKKCVSESLRVDFDLPDNFYGIIAVDPPSMPDAQEDYMRSILGISYPVFDETETILARKAKFAKFQERFREGIASGSQTIPTPPEALRMFSPSTKLYNVTIALKQGPDEDSEEEEEWTDACVHALPVSDD